jgi:hypothetical protein
MISSNGPAKKTKQLPAQARLLTAAQTFLAKNAHFGAE